MLDHEYAFLSEFLQIKKFIYYAKLSFSAFLITLSLYGILAVPAYSQSSAQIEGAKAKLSTMTPEEIQAAVAKYGMTMEEAQAKASSVGIDLQSYLKGRAVDSTPTGQPQTQVNIQLTPSQTNPNGVMGQSGVTAPGILTPGLPISDTSHHIGPATLITTPTVLATDTLKATKEAAPIIGPGGIPYFGYNLFKGRTSDFDNNPNLTDNSYIIGKGDVLRISLWGDTQSMNDYTVDDEGRIVMQPVGAILVAGYTLDQAKKMVLHTLARSVAGLTGRPPTTMLDLTISRLRPLHAYVMGEVANPGAYSMNPFSTVFNALFTVGGPLIQGGMREIRLVRNGKTAVKVDLYDYLIGTEKTNDIRINENDMIFVPLRGRTVGIRGAVPRSAYYELLPNENLRRLLEFSGGIRNTFYLQRIQIDRIVPFAERKPGELERQIFDVDFTDILLHGKDYKLEDGDIVTIYPIQDEKENYVQISGAVWRPGIYQLEKVPRIKDLIQEADSLDPEAYMNRAKLVRTYEDKHTDVFYIDLNRAMAGDTHDNLELESWDSLYVYTWQEILANTDSVRVEGIAKHPGAYPLYGNFTLYNLVKDAVGLSDTLFRQQVYLQRADLVRLNKDRYTSRIITFNLWDLFQDHIKDTLLLPGDRIIIYPINTVLFTDRYIDIGGSVKTPGRYKLSENMTVLDLLLEAGGYTEDASTDQAEVSRLERSGIGRDSLTRILYVSIPDFFDPNALSQEKIAQYRATSFRLQHRDQVFIRPDPNYIFQKNVTIYGEVNHPGTYVISNLKEHLSDLIRRAGGIKNGGYAEGGKVVRGGMRMRINVRYALEDPEGDDDIMVQSNDTIMIPKQPFAVMISGEVNNPGLFSYVDGNSASYYIKGSGGVTDSADFILITFPTGISKQVGTHWWSSNPKIPDGSSIFVVKEKPEPPEPITAGPKTTTFDFIKDVFAITVSAVTIIVLAAKL
jgi:protein involved in polysaccharide export with SLBB domain